MLIQTADMGGVSRRSANGFMNIISDVLGGDIVPPRLAVGSLPLTFRQGSQQTSIASRKRPPLRLTVIIVLSLRLGLTSMRIDGYQ